MKVILCNINTKRAKRGGEGRGTSRRLMVNGVFGSVFVPGASDIPLEMRSLCDPLL